MEPSGALVCINLVTVPGAPAERADLVMRYTFASPPEIVFDERNGNPVKIHASHLVTGP